MLKRDINPTRNEHVIKPGSMAISARAATVLKISSSKPPQEVHTKNPLESFPPASLTKMLTVITALDVASKFGCSLNTMLEVMPEDEVGGSGANINLGDSLSFQDALANTMLPSSNITANLIARTFGEVLVENERHDIRPVERFVQEMNGTAAKLGMSNSNFVNPHGLHNEAQVTTSADMALLLVGAIGSSIVTELWGHATYDMFIEGPNARTQRIVSSVKMLADKNVWGGKTGTIRARVYNLAIFSQTSSGAGLASVVLCAPSDDARYADIRLLLGELEKSC